MSKKPSEDELLTLLDKGIREILNDPKAKINDRLKAIEIASKLLMIRHKIKDGGNDGSFFGG